MNSVENIRTSLRTGRERGREGIRIVIYRYSSSNVAYDGESAACCYRFIGQRAVENKINDTLRRQ